MWHRETEQRVRTQAARVRSRRWGKMEKGAGKRQSHFLLLSGEPSLRAGQAQSQTWQPV